MLNAKEKARDARLKREYQVTLEERTQLSKFQKDRCAICLRLERDMNVSLSLDHCHTTGLVRGLVCTRCNKGLALFLDHPERLAAAAEYLNNPPFVQVFGERFTAPGRVGTKKRRKLLAKMRINEESSTSKKERITKRSSKQIGVR